VREAGLRRLRDAPASRLGGLILLAVVVAMVAVRIGPAFRSGYDRFQETRELSRLSRELAPVRSADTDPQPIEAAAAVIPPRDTFAILVGEDYPFPNEGSRLTLPAWAAYRLLPRRRVGADTAEWVISYDADLAANRVVPVSTIDLGEDVTLARVR
jgi:hypothetical protein